MFQAYLNACVHTVYFLGENADFSEGEALDRGLMQILSSSGGSWLPLQPPVLFYQPVFLQAGNRQHIVGGHCKQAFVAVEMFYFVEVDDILAMYAQELLLF